MKMEIKKPLPITIAIIVISISTIILNRFALQAIHNGKNLWVRILYQGSFCLMILLYGVDYFVYQKQKVLGSFLWLVSAFLLFKMVNTIITSGGI